MLVGILSSFAFYCRDKHHEQKLPEEERAISSSGSPPIMKRSQAGTQGRSLEAKAKQGSWRNTSYWLTLPSSDSLSYLSWRT